MSEKQNRPGTFAKGNDPRRNKGGRKSSPRNQYVESEGPKPEPGVPEILADMRWIQANEEQDGEPYRLKVYRDALKKDPKGFVAQRTALERELLQKAAGRTDGQPSKPRDGERCQTCGQEFYVPGGDPGSARIRALLDKLEEDWKEEQASNAERS